METDWRLKKAQELRAEANRLEKESNRPLPDKWKVGQRVRFLRGKEWAWSEGSVGEIVSIKEEYKNKKAYEYQVFTTKPIPDKNGFRWWTTPDDVEILE